MSKSSKYQGNCLLWYNLPSSTIARGRKIKVWCSHYNCPLVEHFTVSRSRSLWASRLTCSARAPVHHKSAPQLSPGGQLLCIHLPSCLEWEKCWKIICFHCPGGIECCELMALYCIAGHCINTLLHTLETGQSISAKNGLSWQDLKLSNFPLKSFNWKTF